MRKFFATTLLFAHILLGVAIIGNGPTDKGDPRPEPPCDPCVVSLS